MADQITPLDGARLQLGDRRESRLGPTSDHKSRLRGIVGYSARILQSSTIFLVLLAAWPIVVAVFEPPPFLLPSPGSVWDSITNPLMNWQHHLWITSLEAGAGFLIAATSGIVLAIGAAWSPLGSRLILPPMVLINTLPKVAVAPLVIVYLGFGVPSNIAMAALIAFFPILINTAVGLQQTEEELIDVARSVDAPKWRVFALLRIPSAIPYIVSGLKISSTFAVTGAVFGEFLASRDGLGQLVLMTQVNLQMNIAFAALFYLALLGIFLYYGVEWAGRLLFPWMDQSSIR